MELWIQPCLNSSKRNDQKISQLKRHFVIFKQHLFGFSGDFNASFGWLTTFNQRCIDLITARCKEGDDLIKFNKE